MNEADLPSNEYDAGLTDTAARTGAEGAIERLRRRGGVFVDAVRATRMAMVLTDPTLPGNPIVFANQAFLDLSGYDMEEVLGQQPYFMNGRGTDPGDAERFRRALEEDRDVVVETVQYRKDGARFIATVLLSAFKDEDGRTLNHFLSWADVTARVDAQHEAGVLRVSEAGLRESAARQTFLLKLNDTLRPIADPEGARAAAARLLGQHLGANRVAYAENIPGEEAYYVTRNYVDGVPEVVGRFSYTDYGPDILSQLESGEIRIQPNIQEDPHLAEAEKRRLAEAGVGASLNVPLVKNGQLVAFLGINYASAHQFTPDEIELVREVAERTWAAVERARAEHLLQESELKYRTLFDTIDEGFCIIEVLFDAAGEPADYRFLEANPAFERQTGLADAVGRTMKELAPDHERHWFDTYGRIARTRQPERFEDRAQALGRWFDVFAFPIGAPDEHRVAILFRDVIERKRTEAALLESQARLAAAFESVPVGVAVIDLTGHVIIANAEYRRFLPSGIIPSRDKERGFRWQAWDDDGRLLAPDEFPGSRALRGESVIPGQEMLYTDDYGREIWTNVATAPTLDDAGRVSGIVSVISDIDERKRSAEALRDSEARLRQFGEASRDVLWIREADRLQWTYLTPAFETIYGIGREEATSGDNYRSWLDMIVPEERAMADSCIAQVRNGEHVTFEYRIRRPSDGELRWLRNTDFPIRDANGQVTLIGGVGEDVTDQKRDEERMEVLVAELQHRVRNILSVIRSVFTRTVEAGGEVEEMAEHFRGRLDALARTQVVVTQSPRGLVDLENLIREELLSVGSGDGSQLVFEGPEVPLSPAAAETLGLAIHELTTNSLKYGALKFPDGSVQIRWSLSTAEAGARRLKLAWEEDGVPALSIRPQRQGFGTELIEQALPYRLGAETRLEFRPGGIRCTIEFQLSEAGDYAGVSRPEDGHGR